MENDNEISLSEAKKITAELKASILKLDALNSEVKINIAELETLNLKMKDYTSIISKFEFKDEREMTTNYASYLAFLSKKIEELGESKSLKKIEKIIVNSEKMINFSLSKFVAAILISIASLTALTLIK